MEQVFAYTTTSKIDAKLEYDTLAHEDKMSKIYACILIILMFIFRGWIGYWLKFGVAIPSGYDIRPIDVISDPIQINYSPEEQKQKIITYHSLIKDYQIELIPQAHYILSGKAVAYNHDFLFVNNFFDNVALYDLGTSWGELSNKTLFQKYITTYSSKVEMTGSRRLNWRWRGGIPLTGEYINSHISHSHIIPANRNIMAGFLRIKEWDTIQVEGELIDIDYTDKKYSRKIEYHTSLSRTDIDASSRGSGACEAIYVTKLRVGNTIYK